MGGQHAHSHHALHVHEQRTERGRATRKVTLVSGVVNLLLSVAQVVVGYIANSAALVADGVESKTDIPTSWRWNALRRFDRAVIAGDGVMIRLPSSANE